MQQEPPIPKLIIKSHKQYQKVMKEYDSIPENFDAEGHLIRGDENDKKRMALADAMMYYNYKFSVSDKTKYANVDWKKVGKAVTRANK